MFDVYLFWPQSIPAGYDTLIEMCIYKWDSKNQRFEYDPHVVDFLVGRSALCNILAIEFFVIFNPEIYSLLVIFGLFSTECLILLWPRVFFFFSSKTTSSFICNSIFSFELYDVISRKFSLLWCDNYCPIEATKLDSSEKKEIIFIIQ